jgi:hypothetical protein
MPDDVIGGDVTRQDNDLVALRGASVCAGFEAKFDRAWAKT